MPDDRTEAQGRTKVAKGGPRQGSAHPRRHPEAGGRATTAANRTAVQGPTSAELDERYDARPATPSEFEEVFGDTPGDGEG